MASGSRRASNQQCPRRVLVEAVDELGAAAVVANPVEEAVEMLRRLGSALRREAGRLVEHERGGVLVNHHVADELLFLGHEWVALRLRTDAGRRALLRRNADLLPRFDAVAGNGTLAGQAQLPGPRPARHGVEANVWQVPLEPSVQADSVIVIIDSESAHLG